MGSRLALLLLATALYSVSPWLAAGILALSVPLPWLAVPGWPSSSPTTGPRRRRDRTSSMSPAVVLSTQPQLEDQPHLVVDGAVDN
jgi:hypothetical protein